MGLGKTLQVIALLVLLKKKGGSANEPSLLVVPASLIANWRAEIARFAPSLSVFVAHPSEVAPAELGSARLRRRSRSATSSSRPTAPCSASPGLTSRSWNVVVLDEAQAIKNPGAKQTRAVKTLRARIRLALTGTPVENRLGDLWSLFDFTCPGLLGSRQGVRSLRQIGREACPRRLRSAARAGPSLHSSPPEERQARDRGSAGQDRGARVLRPHQEAGRPLSTDGGRAARRAAERRRHEAPRGRPRLAHAAQTDLQSPVALAGRRFVRTRGERKVRASCRARRRDRGQAREGADLHPVPRDDASAGGLSRRRLWTTGPRAARARRRSRSAWGSSSSFSGRTARRSSFCR